MAELGDFYEDDEPMADIRAILRRPPDGVTAPPDPVEILPGVVVSSAAWGPGAPALRPRAPQRRRSGRPAR
ncbi:MAG: hypothetical protein ACT4PP_12970 [Sporichthyaceae bacterium]